MDEIFKKTLRELKLGQPVIFPTDTVWGVGVSVKHCLSPEILYELKQRDERKPIAWLVGDKSALDEYGEGVSSCARQLVDKYWPGALTLIVKASNNVPPKYRSKQNTIGLRMPASSEALTLIKALENPIATTSANFSGDRPTASNVALDEAFANSAGVLNLFKPAGVGGGASAVIDCTGDSFKVLRRGDMYDVDIYDGDDDVEKDEASN